MLVGDTHTDCCKGQKGHVKVTGDWIDKSSVDITSAGIICHLITNFLFLSGHCCPERSLLLSLMGVTKI